MKNTNKTHIEGILYQHSLVKKVSGENSKKPGTEFITGTIDIATDDACLNIVSVHYTYETATRATGKANGNYTILNDILNGKLGTMMGVGKDNAAKLRIDSAIGLNDFYVNRNGVEELVSAKRNEGGFIHVVTDALTADEKLRSTFETDIVITNVRRIEADENRNLPEKVIVKGAIFDFRKTVLPVEFTAKNPHAMDYFESLEASPSNPVFTKVKGRQISETIITRTVEEGAFGEPSVKESRSSNKEFLITWAQGEPYAWDEEGTITAIEFKEAIAARETYLATVKQRYNDSVASRSTTSAPSAFATPKANTFNF